MTRAETEALERLTKSIEVLARKVDALDVLAEPKTAEALKGLVVAAPALIELADGYRLAGKAGNGIKWIAGFVTTMVAAYAALKLWVWG